MWRDDVVQIKNNLYGGAVRQKDQFYFKILIQNGRISFKI